jgi:threonine/homoserine/homoserine lactone efflux protein
VLSAFGFSAVLLWTTTGALLTRFLKNARNALIFNVVLALFLVYTALSTVLH